MSITEVVGAVGLLLSLPAALFVVALIVRFGVVGPVRGVSTRVAAWLFMTAVVGAITFVLASAVFASAWTGSVTDVRRTAWINLVGASALAVTMLLLCRGRPIRSVVGLARGVRSALLPGFGLAPLMFLCLLGVGALAAAVFHRIGWEQKLAHPLLETLRTAPTPGLIVAVVLAATVAAPLAEELLFRGTLQSGLIALMRPIRRPALKRWLAIVLVSTAFAMVHEWWSRPSIFVLSLVLGWVYERTGNLWASVLLHSAFNGIQTFLFLLLRQSL